MLHARMDKFAKLPPITGKRASPQPNMTSVSDGGVSGDGPQQKT
jgi:hypothetical protein